MGVLDAPARTAPGIHGDLYNFKAANFLKWRRALARTRGGLSDSKLLIVDDSTACGVGGSTGSTIPQNKSWPTGLASLMNTYMVPTTRGLAIPKSKGTSQTADTRWTPGTGWALNSGISQQWVGFGGFGAFYGSTTASTTLTYADGVLADTYDIWYVSLSSNATFTAQATGGSSVTGTQPGGSTQTRKITVSAGSASTSNTVTITHDATTKLLIIFAIEPYLANTRQVRVGNGAASGSSTAEWVGYPFGSTANVYGPIDSIKNYAPDLTIIGLGINDAGAGMSAATFLANLQLIIAAAQVSGDVILKTMVPSDPTATPNRVPLENQFISAMKSLGLPVIDIFARIGSYSAYSGGGFMTDTLHPNDDGYGDMAGTVFGALRVAA